MSLSAEVPTAAREDDALPGRLADVHAWVESVAALTQPDEIVWCDGSQAEWYRLTQQMVAAGTLIPLNPELRPNSFLARSDPGDVARVEERTFVSTAEQVDAGPTNNWRETREMRAELRPLFEGAMRGRTMYVVPFSMGPVGGAISQVGVQVTDSPYAVISMRIMTRMGEGALREIESGAPWVAGVHTVGYPLVDAEGQSRPDVPWPANETKYIVHFPEQLEIWSYGSGYGGNALLSKKCFALRIASAMGKREGWLAEHMLLLKLTSPEEKVYYVAAAFPSACGKTNLAMLQPTIPGWQAETIGDDIAWLRPGPDGLLYAINPEAGFFGVAPGTGYATNPVAMETIWGNTIFTNVALTDEGDVWWEGMTDKPPAHAIDWQGNDWTPASGRPAAHPNSRFTVSIMHCPSVATEWTLADGVPVDAILFGGRRATNVPLVQEAFDWGHGVFIGATISSEQTAAAEGVVGELRRDPFAMLPFCGYNMADYWSHWLRLGARLGPNAPRIFQVNWFRKGSDGRFLWPGFGENSRVLEWVARRLDGEDIAQDTPTGRIPKPGTLNTEGIDISEEDLAELFAIDPQMWLQEADLTEEYFARFGDRLPAEMTAHLAALRKRLAAAAQS